MKAWLVRKQGNSKTQKKEVEWNFWIRGIMHLFLLVIEKSEDN